MNQKHVVLPIVVLAVAVFASSGVFSPAWAPKPQPEKIQSGPIKPVGGNALELELKAQFGTATAGDNALFTVATALVIQNDTGDVIAELSGETPLEKQPGAERDADGMIALVPQLIPWDRGTFTGLATVTVTVDLRNNGSSVAGATATTTHIVDFR